jgi:predicted esterase
MKNAEVIEPKGEHKFSMIFSHGLGDEGASFIDVFEMLSLKNTRVILPNAPVQPVTCNGGYRMPAWYDIYNLGPNRDLINDKQDEKGILESSEKILELVDAEAAKVGYKNVFIGGFSQGAAMSMFTAMRCQHELGGVIAASGYALLPAQGDANIHTKTTPMLVYHGVMDPVAPLAGALQAPWRDQHRVPRGGPSAALAVATGARHDGTVLAEAYDAEINTVQTMNYDFF